MISWLGNAIASLLGMLWDLIWEGVVTLVSFLWNQIAHLLATKVGPFLVSLLPSGWQDYWTQKPWETLYQYMDLVNYFTAFYAVLSIAFASLMIAASIRLGRWMLALVPRWITGAS